VGPETDTWEAYSHGAFRPTAPPGPPASCTPGTLAAAADPAGLLGLALASVSCADGWALGTGTAPGYAGGFVGLFEQRGGDWQVVNVDDGTALGRDPQIYDIPLSVLERLGSGLGPRVVASVATGTVYRGLDLAQRSTLWTMSGEIPFRGATWLLAAGQPSGGGSTLSINVYRWSGATWAEKAAFPRVPDGGSLVGTGQWYAAVPAAGSAAPTFVVRGTYPRWSARIAWRGGTWRVTSQPGA
jgi:hypothetical protein